MAVCACGWAVWLRAWGWVVWVILGELMTQKKPRIWGCGAVAVVVGGYFRLPVLLALVALS